MLVALLRRAPTAYWAMDLNPDQLIFLTQPLSHDLSADLTHPRQRRAVLAAQRLDRVHRARDIAVILQG